MIAMSGALIGLLVVVVIIVLFVVYVIAKYNGLIGLRNKIENAYAQIDVQLTRRHDLIPNLVETVKGYAAHERRTFEAVTAARAGAVSAQTSGDPGRVGPAENALTSSLRTLFAVAENYPQLRAVDSFLQLQEELTATEDKLEFARHFYNTSVRDYNVAIQTFPRSVLARAFGFSPVGFFETAAGGRDVPQVSLTGPELPVPERVQPPGTSSS